MDADKLDVFTTIVERLIDHYQKGLHGNSGGIEIRERSKPVLKIIAGITNSSRILI